MGSGASTIIVDCGIWVLWVVLNIIDLVLVNGSKLFHAVFADRASNRETATQKPKVVIIGASFAGLAVEHKLSHHSDEIDVAIVDYKEYFEYVPGALRCFIEPKHFRELSCPLRSSDGSTFVKGEVVGVSVATGASKRNEVKFKDGRSLPYDYLIVGAGSTYSSPIKATTAEITIGQRQTQWNQAAADLDRANSVVILGAGAVGVELAAEILTKYNPTSSNRAAKRVILVDMAPKILPGFMDASVKYATKWLKENGAELRLGSPLKSIDEKSVTFSDGTTLEVDLVYKCVGVAPNTGFLKGGDLAAALKGPRGSLVVNHHFQLDGYDHVFCAGDLSYHDRSNELKLGHTAEVNAHLVAENVLRLVRSNRGYASLSAPTLLSYPDGVVGNVATPKIYNLSLGKYDATLGFNALVINGPLAAIVKWLLEWTKVASAEKRPVGIFFWLVADNVSNFLGRTVLPTPVNRNKRE